MEKIWKKKNSKNAVFQEQELNISYLQVGRFVGTWRQITTVRKRDEIYID